MDKQSMDALVEAFGQQADKIKNHLNNLLLIVSGGSVPVVDDMNVLNAEVQKLAEKYKQIFELTRGSVLPEELPAFGSSVLKCAEAVEHSKIQMLKIQIVNVSTILSKFINISSPIMEYAEELKPYQNKAKAILAKLNDNNVEELLPESVAPSAFIRAMETENINDPEGIVLLEKVSKFYPQKIQWGLVAKQYHIVEKMKDESTVAMQDQDLAEKKSVEESSLIIQYEGQDNKEEDISESLQKINVNMLDEKPEEVKTRGTSFESAIVNKNICNESIEQKKILFATNRPKSSTPSAASFRKDIINMSKVGVEICTILPLLTNLGVLTEEQIYLYGVCMECFEETDKAKDDVDVCIKKLTAKGYLACFEYEEDEKREMAYCLSNYCYGSMQKDSIAFKMKGFWRLSYGNYKVNSGGEIEKETVVNTVKNNARLIEYLYGIKDTLNKNEYQIVRESIHWKKDHYQVSAFEEGEEVSCYLLNPYADVAVAANTTVLALAEDDITILRKNENVTKVLVFSNGAILHYENLSIQETGSVQEEITKSVSDITGEKSRQEQYRSDEQTEILSPHEEEHIKNESEKVGDITPLELLKYERVPTDDEFVEAIVSIVTKYTKTKEQLTTAIVQGVLLAKGAGMEKNCSESKLISEQLRLSTNLLLGSLSYTSECLASTFSDMQKDSPELVLASYMYAMMIPSTAFDYGLKNQINNFFDNYETYFYGLSSFKQLFNKLMSIQDIMETGFSPAVIASLGSDEENEKFICELRKEAQACMIVKAPKTRMKALPIMYGTCFDKGSDLYECMKFICDNDKKMFEIVEDVLAEYCDCQNRTYSINEGKIEDKLEKEWDRVNSKNKFKLEYGARDQALRQFRVRINVMLTWIDHVNSINNKKLDLTRLKALKEEIIKQIQIIQRDASWKSVKYANVLAWAMQDMIHYLNGKRSKLEIYSELLYTGIFSLDDDGSPLIDETLSEIEYYEPWRNVLQHIVTKKKLFDELKVEILGGNINPDEGEGLKDNLHQLEMIGKYRGSKGEDFIITEGQIKEAIESAEDITMRFQEELELAYTYNRINETEKETLLGIMNRYKSSFFDIKDFACWRRFLKALKMQIQQLSVVRQKRLRGELNLRLENNADSRLLLEAKRLLENERNFAVTEEYINRFDVGETDLSDELDNDFDYFNDFLSGKVFDPLFKECQRCTGHSLKAFGWTYVEKHLPKEWTSRLKDDCKTMVMNWPSGKDAATQSQIQTLFSSLGFSIAAVTRQSGKRGEIYQLSINQMPKSMADYRHPISAFGTQAKSPLNVIVLYGNHTEKQLVDTVSALDLGGISIVLIDRPLRKANRRLIGEIFHTQTSGQNPFLLIDQVLFLYLALHQITERLPALLKCTLPYTTYQPFVRDGGSTADEMFYGRVRELATIIDPKGACVVYGGRQLGKTALLERAENRCSKPENKAFAVYSTIIKIKSEEEVVETLVSDIDKKTDGRIKLVKCKSLKEMCAQLNKLFRGKQIESMHLLIDEVDDFLASISEEAYKPIQPLVDLRRETKNSFKFVIAGLHNVCRAKNATKENGIFGQLGRPLCIKPLSPTDALQLLSRPLKYLGFQIDRYPHLETILTNTNYYPGILQFFGYMLVETLSGQYARYYHATDGNPPFTLQDEQLGAVMNSSDLNKSIKDKFRWSLELDARYFMIARCITMLYHYYEEDRESGSWMGFPVKEIMDMASSYPIHCLKNETQNTYNNLLDEMVDMGILSQPTEGFYRLRRNLFVDIIGENIDVLDADILNNNEEVFA